MVFWVVLKRGLEMINSIKIWGDRDVATVALSMLDGGVTLATIDIWAPMVAYSYFTPKADQKAISAAGQYDSQVASVEDVSSSGTRLEGSLAPCVLPMAVS